MTTIDLLLRNRAWAAEIASVDPDFFSRLVADHSPGVLFVGCSDARVPLDVVTRAGLGELFIHRNIANQVLPSDASLAAGLQYAVEVLGVDDVVVCGHHRCGGCRAALMPDPPAAVDAWISPLRLLSRLHEAELRGLAVDQRQDRLAELNVVEQVRNLARHPSVRAAWAAGRPLNLHAWVFEMASGLMRPQVKVGPGEVWHDLAKPVVLELASG